MSLENLDKAEVIFFPLSLSLSLWLLLCALLGDLPQACLRRGSYETPTAISFAQGSFSLFLWLCWLESIKQLY